MAAGPYGPRICVRSIKEEKDESVRKENDRPRSRSFLLEAEGSSDKEIDTDGMVAVVDFILMMDEII